MRHRYHSNGKLLISGEYLVARGGKALVVPVKLGMWMEVALRESQNGRYINWNARVMDRDWFNARISMPEMIVSDTSDDGIAGRLAEILKAVDELNKELMHARCEYDIKTHTEFDQAWGLGSSSALIANLAQWAGIDPFELFFRVSGGSGYDVAAALARGPIVYSAVDRQVRISPVLFLPSFRDHLWFAYLGNKQDTNQSLGQFNLHITTDEFDTGFMNSLTHSLLHASSLHDFMHYMHEHEIFLSQLLGERPVKDEKFHDFKGEIKSLGAWGGDFIMIASENSPDYVRSYFTGRRMPFLFSFDELILT